MRDSHVSRHHCELRLITREGREPSWELLGQGKNGTFLNGELITQAELFDEATIQLAPKGPVLKIYLRDRIPDRDDLLFSSLSKDAQRALLQRESLKRKLAEEAEAGGAIAPMTPLGRETDVALVDRPRLSTGTGTDKNKDKDKGGSEKEDMSTDGQACDHVGNHPNNLLCVRCGQPLRVIRTVGQYQLLRLLGKGGMGTTFLAWRTPHSPEHQQQPPGQRLVVVKQLNADVALIPKARELFEREAAVLKQVNHVGIPRFLDAFSEQDQAYLVMELIHGQNLEQFVLKHGSVKVNQAIHWMQQTCDVLHHLHTHYPPILHRDIKPANLLRQYRDSRIIVVDFGAVKAMAGVMGTCIKAEGYTAPEQEAGKPTIASDLFSVGATLVFLLTRKTPLSFLISADEMSLAGATQIPLDLQQVLEKALAQNVSDRYSSALELKLALGTCLEP